MSCDVYSKANFFVVMCTSFADCFTVSADTGLQRKCQFSFVISACSSSCLPVCHQLSICLSTFWWCWSSTSNRMSLTACWSVVWMHVHMIHLLINMQRLLEEEERSGRNLQQQLRQQLANASATISAKGPTADQQVSTDSCCSSVC